MDAAKREVEKSAETSTVEERKLASSSEMDFNPRAFDQFFERFSASVSSGKDPEVMRKTRATFVIPEELQRPDTFNGPIKIGLEELNSADEEQVLLKLPPQVNEQSMSVALAKRAIVDLNGRRLQSHEVDMVWDALKMGGRIAAGSIYILHCSGMNEAHLGNSLDSVELD